MKILKTLAIRRSALVLAVAGASLSGCANKYDAVTPELQTGMMSDLQAGKLTLDCGVKCDFTWLQHASAIHALDLAEKWNDVAVQVMQIGYGSDLAYYYLGQAAQGLGYHEAAITYYATSLSLVSGSNAFLQCAAGRNGLSDPCQGIDLAGSIPVLIQASRDALASEAEQRAQQQASATPAPARTHRRHHAASPAGSAAPSSSSPDWAVPPPPAPVQ